MRKLEYRLPRTFTAFPIEFCVNGESLRGLCKDVSDTGIRAELLRPAISGSCGLLTLHHPEGVVKLPAQIAYVEGSTVGLSFIAEAPEKSSPPAPLIFRVPDRPFAK